MCKGEASIHHGPVALRIPALQEPADLNIHLSAPTHVLKQKAQSVEAAFSQLPPWCSGVCSRHTQPGILAVRCNRLQTTVKHHYRRIRLLGTYVLVLGFAGAITSTFDFQSD